MAEEETKPVSCPEIENVEDCKTTSSNQEVNQVDNSLQEKDEKKESDKSDIFKKPVFLIGPRKGKAVGKVQVYKPADAPDSTTEARDLLAEDQENEEEKEIASSCPPAAAVVEKEPEKSIPDNKRLQKVSPAQKLNDNSVPLPYKEPKWSGIPSDTYKFEVLKNGSIVDTIELSSKPYFVFGRLSTCDVHMAHPTVSRFHAVLQFRTDDSDEGIGFYIYDLGSTHGTFLNKYRIKPNMYVRVHVGHQLKLGGSTRLFILHGPEEDMEKESDLTVTELKAKRKEEQMAKELQDIKELEELRLQQEKEENDGIDWGMGDDADEETDLADNPFAATQNEELYLDDPKKTLRGWFEREGYDLEYNVEEKGFGQFLCRVEVPVEFAKGGTIIAESLVKGKKKEAVVQCALEACRILDRYGLLRQAKHESRKRKAKNWEENDYYDSDEDEFLDRTGTVEKKRQQRMKAAGKIQKQTETYESLLKKHGDILSQIEKLQKELDDAVKPNKKKPEIAEEEEEDALDAFMTNLSSEVPDKLVNKLKTELLSLRKEEAHVRKLVNIACPASLPKLIEDPSSQPGVSSHLRGKLPQGLKRKVLPSSSQATGVNNNTESNSEMEREEEEEEEDEEEEKEEDKNDIIKEVGERIVDSTEEKEKETNVVEVSAEEVLRKEATHVLDSKQKDKISSENLSDVSSVDNKNISKDDTVNNGKVMGPTLPPEDFVPEGHSEKRKKRPRQRQNKKGLKESDVSSSSDPNYSMWVPPEGQSGDGRTKLNERYGY